VISANWVDFTGPERSLTLFGIQLIGINIATAHKLLLTVVYVLVILGIAWVIQKLVALLPRRESVKRWNFWGRQALRLITALLLIVGILSVWFNDSARLGTFLGLVSAGLAFALQRVVTAFAGYFVILRGNTFTVGDRITMGGVRGDVIKLGFVQTTIMEMGQPPGEQADDPAMWVQARQYTGRIVTVTNDKVFDTPIYNYSKEFPFIWEEMRIPISYKDDRKKAEEIILRAAHDCTVNIAEASEPVIREMEQRYVMKRSEMKPRTFLRLTDNWVELSVRFISLNHDVRSLKDKMSRRILDDLEKAHIGIASSTYDIVGLPPIKVTVDPGGKKEGAAADEPGAT
jgi:small-conductance mechanosensitive channel